VPVQKKKISELRFFNHIFNEEKQQLFIFKFVVFFLVCIGLFNVWHWVYANWNNIEPGAWIFSIGLNFRKQIINLFST